MSLERLYYNDPFSNVIFSVDLLCEIPEDTLLRVLRNTLQELPVLGLGLSLNEQSALVYTEVGHKRNLENIAFSRDEEVSVLKELAAHPFALHRGESIRIVVQTLPTGYRMFFCLHHIIGDGGSLLLLIRQFVARLQNAPPPPLSPVCPAEGSGAELDLQGKYLVSTVNKRYPRRSYSRSEYRSMQESLYGQHSLQIQKYILPAPQFRELKQLCKKLGVSVTAYFAAELFARQNVERICLPVDTRQAPNCFGNFVGRIDLFRKDPEPEAALEDRACYIHRQIQSQLADPPALSKGEAILEALHPGFFDDIIFSTYTHRSDPFAKKMGKLIGYKDATPTSFVSNLKTVSFDPDDRLQISRLCFYPPHPAERVSTIGIVTCQEEMIVTVQQFIHGETPPLP